jgi:phosphoribosylcarboxyaminoimidazole (NCAIR) mutase
VNQLGNSALPRFADEKMNVLGHHNIPCHYKMVASAHPLQSLFKEFARRRYTQILEAVIATEGEEMKTPGAFVSDEFAGHGRKDYTESQLMSNESIHG